ncbi:hypothetical protein, partial [Pseudoflavonifractor capillosus]|uniref:hypothetical protein n=1 Tax=Pseudoflavonifractor capillosus TaxID=106588 RepID=UPI002A83F248
NGIFKIKTTVSAELIVVKKYYKKCDIVYVLIRCRMVKTPLTNLFSKKNIRAVRHRPPLSQHPILCG